MSPDISLRGIGNGTGEITSQYIEIFMQRYIINNCLKSWVNAVIKTPNLKHIHYKMFLM